MGSIVELGVSFEDLGVAPGDDLSFTVAAMDGDVELERHPAYRPIETAVPTEDFEALNWTA